MAHDVFISYSTKDKPVADAMCAALEREGARCWIAPRDVLPGTDWGEAIINAIAGSRIMVLIFSVSSNASAQVRREVERAVHRDVAIVPFRIEAATPSKSLEYFISTPHWLDAVNGPMEQHLEKLARTVRLLLNRPEVAEETGDRSTVAAVTASAPAADASPARSIPAEPRPDGRQTRHMTLVAVCAAIAAVTLGIVLWRIPKPERTVRQRGSQPATVADSGSATSPGHAVEPIGVPLIIGHAKPYEGLDAYPDRIRFSSDGRFLLATPVAYLRGSLLWNLEQGTRPRKYDSFAIFSPDTRSVAEMLGDGSVRVSDTVTEAEQRVVHNSIPDWGSALAFSPDSNVLAFPRIGNGFDMVSLHGAPNQRHFDGGRVMTLTFTPDGQSIVVGEDRYHLSLQDVTTGEVKWRKDAEERLPIKASFSADGARMVLVWPDDKTKTALVLETRTGQVQARLEHDREPGKALFTPDGREVLTIVLFGDAPGLHIWDVSSWREQESPQSLPKGIGAQALSISADGARALVGYEDKTARLYDALNWKELAKLDGHGGPVLDVAFSSDGRFAATVAADKIARVWRLPPK